MEHSKDLSVLFLSNGRKVSKQAYKSMIFIKLKPALYLPCTALRSFLNTCIMYSYRLKFEHWLWQLYIYISLSTATYNENKCKHVQINIQPQQLVFFTEFEDAFTLVS